MFGVSLSDSIIFSKLDPSKDIPIVVSSCLEYISMPKNIAEEGIYRVSGSMAQINRLKGLYDDGITILL